MSQYKLIKLETDNCPGCTKLGTFMDAKGIKYESFNINTLEGATLAEKHNMMSAPLLLKVDEEGNEIDRLQGFILPEVRRFLEVQ